MNHKSIAVCCLGIAMLLSAGLTAQEKKQPLVGKWKNDQEQTKRLLVELGDPDIDQVLASVKDILLNFKDDGTFVMSMGGQEMSGKWKTEALDTEGRFALTLTR